MTTTSNKTFGSSLLVAGTAIGAGMLALPITTGAGGFIAASGLLVASFLFMLLSLFVLLEANLWCKDPEANIITMAGEHLGVVGQAVAWVAFLLLLYSVAAAYMAGGGSLISELSHHVPGFDMSDATGVGMFVIVFGLLILGGTRCVDYINRVLMVGLIISYVGMLIFVVPHVQVHNLTVGQPHYLLLAVPVVMLSFTSHIILPSLRTYLGGNIANLKKTLFIGSLTALLIYLLWELIVLGVVPLYGKNGLMEIAVSLEPVVSLTNALEQDLGLAWIGLAVGGFSFFALVTSFLGVTLSLSDFLADGFHIKKTYMGRLLVLILTLAPPLFFALYSPSGFVLALGYAGVFVAVLYGILPALMVWKGRYLENLPLIYRVPGGKLPLIIVFLGGLLVIFLQVAATLNYLPKPGV